MNFKRWSFNPCLWGSEIYLSGGPESRGTIEVHEPVTNTIRVAEVMLTESSAAVSWVTHDLLTVVTGTQVVKLGKLDGEVVCVETRTVGKSVRAFNSMPMVYRDRVFFVEGSECCQFEASTGESDN